MSLIFVNTTQCSRGKGASVRLISKESIVQGDADRVTRTTQYGFLDEGWTQALPSMTVEEFESNFTEYEVMLMQNNGVLDYYPDGYASSISSGYIWTDTSYKYPRFSAKIYKKYGRALTPCGEIK